MDSTDDVDEISSGVVTDSKSAKKRKADSTLLAEAKKPKHVDVASTSFMPLAGYVRKSAWRQAGFGTTEYQVVRVFRLGRHWRHPIHLERTGQVISSFWCSITWYAQAFCHLYELWGT